MATILQWKVAKRRLLEKVSLERCPDSVKNDALNLTFDLSGRLNIRRNNNIENDLFISQNHLNQSLGVKICGSAQMNQI